MDDHVNGRGPLNKVKANLFKGLSHPVRIRVLELLSVQAEVSVTELLAETTLEASHLSQHLAVLRRYDLVVSQRRGLQMFYSLAHPQVAELLAVAKELLQEILRTTERDLASALSAEPSAAATASPATVTDSSAASATISGTR
ncbi:metalloregulator ArsR/SmtB family transcription factor [Nesterenkonia sp. YGD6]|uniref:ArsR/SmtB family transcription factor n=1 Tax=Nesterenkonia sp. YGD6 TaxID=2901231 RepID=UPI001F4C559C|nr:metalloregulator ArsR/SmtB family transcription factor [Nesterenkonia sp. YGD6]